MKICSKCHQEKSESEFYPDRRKRAGLHSWCKSCMNEANRAIYRRNNSSGKQRNARQLEQRRRFKKAAVENCGGACSICGYNKCLDALEFHHLDDKEYTIAALLLHASTMSAAKEEVLKAELSKCILVCANCHREIHSRNEEPQP